MNYIHERQAKIFKAFCDEKRQRILELLQDGELCNCVLTEKMNIPQSSLSYHMKILCESQVVNGREEGKWTFYSINEEGVLKAIEYLQNLYNSSTVSRNTAIISQIN